MKLIVTVGHMSQIVRDTGLTAADAWAVADDRSTWRALLRPTAGYAQHWLTDCGPHTLHKLSVVITVCHLHSVRTMYRKTSDKLPRHLLKHRIWNSVIY